MDFEKIQINLATTPVSEYKTLDVESMVETDKELLIKLSNKDCYEIFPGQILLFRRYINFTQSPFLAVEDKVKVISEDENHILHVEIPQPKKIKLSNIYPKMEHVELSGTTYVMFRCDDSHNMYAQDLDADVGQEIYIKDIDGNFLWSATTLDRKFGVPFMTAYSCYFSGGTQHEDKFIYGGEYKDIPGIRKIMPEDCVEFVEEQETCGKPYSKFKTYKYEFFKDFFSLNNFLVEQFEGETFDEDVYPFMSYMETKFNPYYFYVIEQDENGNDIKKCYFYEDNWWSRIENSVHPVNEEYINCGATLSVLQIPNNFWKVNVGLGIDENNGLGVNEALAEYIENDMKESLVPPIVDMERVKYVPVVSGETEFINATALTLDFHFRKRKLNEGDNTNLTKNNIYADGWDVEEERWNIDWWNGMDYSGDAFSDSDFKRFLRDNGTTSDLIGYLNFTDADVYYRKKKVSKSFVRLLFYTSPYMDSQKLLYYSTIYFDEATLFGKYVKQLMFMDEHPDSVKYPDFIKDVPAENSATSKVVFCENTNVSARVDTEIEVTNEYDRTRSAEGFNLYLFAEDAVLKDVDEQGDEKADRTIYMRIEFNHAGNGKTIPMIQNWPKEGDNYIPLTTSNYVESLYIPIKISYINDRYVYYIPSAINDNGNIRLILFEPKLDKEID